MTPIPFTKSTSPPHSPSAAPSPARFASHIHLLSDLTAPPARGTPCLLGMPDDTGVSLNNGRPGAAQGPQAFRHALARYGVTEPCVLARPLPATIDAGDVIPGATLEETHDRVTAAAEAIIALGCFPIGIGGGHDLTFPFVRASCRKREVKAGYYIDAHLDVRAERGSGMPFRALIEQCGVEWLTCIGCEPLVNSREHSRWFHDNGGRLADATTVLESPIPSTDPWAKFLSLDLDAIDASSAPGVSALNPAGMSVTTVASLCRHFGQDPKVLCFDIMELNPVFDRDHQTARVAVYCFLHFLLGYTERFSHESA